jgi:hypothetical protein
MLLLRVCVCELLSSNNSLLNWETTIKKEMEECSVSFVGSRSMQVVYVAP